MASKDPNYVNLRILLPVNLMIYTHINSCSRLYNISYPEPMYVYVCSFLSDVCMHVCVCLCVCLFMRVRFFVVCVEYVSMPMCVYVCFGKDMVCVAW